jgi:phospholipid-translocating P-type ATPase (flippase)
MDHIGGRLATRRGSGSGSGSGSGGGGSGDDSGTGTGTGTGTGPGTGAGPNTGRGSGSGSGSDTSDTETGSAARASKVQQPLGALPALGSAGDGASSVSSLGLGTGTGGGNGPGGGNDGHGPGCSGSGSAGDARDFAPLPDMLHLFQVVLSVCHTIIPEVDEASGEIIYQASSPDENALVYAGKAFGHQFIARTPTTVTVAVTRPGDPGAAAAAPGAGAGAGADPEPEPEPVTEEVTYTLLHVLEFTSTRKRMSVVVRDPGGRVLLLTKGADTVIYERLDARNPEPYRAVTLEHLEQFAVVGLRTLCAAYRYVPEEEYVAWAETFDAAASALVGRDEQLAACAATIEVDLRLIGATAIEDKLQDGVPEAIATLARGGLKIWVLTGDKQETAINIGFSCRVLDTSQRLMLINGAESEARGLLEGFLEDSREEKDPRRLATVIDGATLAAVMADPELQQLYLTLACRCIAVIACRVSPKQKAQIVNLVRENLKTITLAIGDGANDVSMIQAAHVGVGISGEEGLRAARAADYSIAQFRFLLRLLLVHGRWSYQRITKLILWSFYKNIVLYLTQLWYIFHNGYSGQSLYDGWTIAFFNILFANFPALCFAVLEQDVSAEASLRFPQLYEHGQRDKSFRPRVFWTWVGNAIWHSLAVYGLTITSTSNDNWLVGGGYTGRTAGIYDAGMVTFTAVVFVVNLRLALSTRYFTVWTAAANAFSIGSLFLFYLIYHSLYPALPFGADMAQAVFTVAAAPTFWLAGCILVPITVLIPDYIWSAYHSCFEPDAATVIRRAGLGGKNAGGSDAAAAENALLEEAGGGDAAAGAGGRGGSGSGGRGGSRGGGSGGRGGDGGDGDGDDGAADGTDVPAAADRGRRGRRFTVRSAAIAAFWTAHGADRGSADHGYAFDQTEGQGAYLSEVTQALGQEKFASRVPSSKSLDE